MFIIGSVLLAVVAGVLFSLVFTTPVACGLAFIVGLVLGIVGASLELNQ